MSVTIPAVPQVGNCGFYTAAEVVVTGFFSISFRPVELNWLEVRAVGCHPEELTASILDCLLHLASKDFGVVVFRPNNGVNLDFFG